MISGDMGARPKRRSKNFSELPPVRLDMFNPMFLPGGSVLGAEILKELHGDTAAVLFRLLRAVLSWSRDPQHSLDTGIFAGMEAVLLKRLPGPYSSPAGLLAGYMSAPDRAEGRAVAWACVCLSDWAAERGARATALSFAQAAACAEPRNPRYCWVVAAWYKTGGRFDLAEAWLMQCWRVAGWTGDHEAQCLAAGALAELKARGGDVEEGATLRTRAEMLRQRYRVPRAWTDG